jgi:hypothetical protein
MLTSGLVAKNYSGVFEIATAYFIGLAMTLKQSICHCEERSDEAIYTLVTSLSEGNVSF